MDVGALGPLPEVFFTLISGVGFFEGEPFTLDGEQLGVKIAAPQPGDGGAKFMQAGSLYFRVLLGGNQLSRGGLLVRHSFSDGGWRKGLGRP